MKITRYDIFSGQFDKDAMWLGAVEGLVDSVARMKVLATTTPGHYFAFCQETQSIMAFVDSSKLESVEVRWSCVMPNATL